MRNRLAVKEKNFAYAAKAKNKNAKFFCLLLDCCAVFRISGNCLKFIF